MKKQLLVLFAFSTITFVSYGQEEKTTKKNKATKELEDNQEIVYDAYNRWSVELTAGQAKGIKPYQAGYFSSNPAKTLGIQFNSFGAAARYMISPKFGFKLGLNYDKFTNFQDYKDYAEKEFIKFKLEKNNWNVSKTADDIDIQRSHLYSKIEKFGLKRAE